MLETISRGFRSVKNRFQVAQTSRGVLRFGADEVRRRGLLRALWLPGLATNAAACTITVGARIGVGPRGPSGSTDWLPSMMLQP